jgi:cytochrome P450 family 110
MNQNSFRFAYRTVSFLDSHESNPDGVLELCARPTRRLLVWHPEGIDRIFRTDRRMNPMPSRTLSPLLGRTSLLWAEGPRHTAYRRVLGPALRGTSLQACHHIIAHTVHAALDVLVPGTVISLIEWSRQVTLRIISQILLDKVDAPLLGSFRTCVDSVLRSRTRTLAYRCLHAPAAAWPSLLKGRGELDKMLLRSAKATVNSPSPTLAALLLAGTKSIGTLEDCELIDQIVSLLFAGYETTASATAWTLYCLSRNEKVRRDVIDELSATSNDGSDLAQVPLLHAVCHEALRLFPPAFIAGKRMLTADAELLGKPLSAGTIVMPCMYLAHHQSSPFSNPRRFDPSHFLGKRIPRQYYFPFGGGMRRCLGSELAMLEIRMITAAVVRHCKLHCVNPEAGTPVVRGPAMTLPQDLRMLAIPHRRHRGDRPV